MKSLRPMLFFVSLLLIVGLACSFGRGNTPTQPPTDQPIQVNNNPISPPPQPTEVPPTEPPPTDEPTDRQFLKFNHFSLKSLMPPT